MDNAFDSLRKILTEIRILSGTCAVWKRSIYCITDHRTAPAGFMHDCEFCDRFKRKYGSQLCCRHDTGTVPEEIRNRNGEPFMLNCPGGAVELIVPVSSPEQVFGVLFVGPFAHAELRNDLNLPVISETQALALGRLCQHLLTPLGTMLAGIHPEISPRDQRIARAVKFLEQHYGENILMEKVAERFYLSPSRFSHLFAKQCGKSFSAFLQDIRLSVALDLLRFNGWSVADTAKHCGFADPGYFTTVFKQKYHRLPSSYSKNPPSL